MFRPFELGTFLIKTPLRNTSRPYMEPNVVRLVFFSNSFTKFRVRLGIPPVMFPALDLFDPCPTLTIHVLLNKVFKWTRIPQHLRLSRLLICSDGEQGQSINVVRLGKFSPVKGSPWNIRISCRFLMRPKHPKSRTSID